MPHFFFSFCSYEYISLQPCLLLSCPCACVTVHFTHLILGSQSPHIPLLSEVHADIAICVGVFVSWLVLSPESVVLQRHGALSEMGVRVLCLIHRRGGEVKWTTHEVALQLVQQVHALSLLHIFVSAGDSDWMFFHTCCPLMPGLFFHRVSPLGWSPDWCGLPTAQSHAVPLAFPSQVWEWVALYTQVQPFHPNSIKFSLISFFHNYWTNNFDHR